MWEGVRRAYLSRTGKSLEVKQLQKRFYYLQERVKGKLKKRNSTGGGPAIMLSENENCLLNIFGEGNPKFCEVPGAISTAQLSTAEDVLDTEVSDVENSEELRDEAADCVTNTQPTGSVDISLVRRSSRLSVSQFNELFELEKSKLVLEKEKLSLEKDTLFLQQKKLTLEIEKLKFEMQQLHLNGNVNESYDFKITQVYEQL